MIAIKKGGNDCSSQPDHAIKLLLLQSFRSIVVFRWRSDTIGRMDLRTLIVSVIADTLKIEVETIRDDSQLIDLAPDSIALFELLIRFEKALGQSVRYED